MDIITALMNAAEC